MRSFKFLLPAVAALSVLGVLPTRAEIYVYQDPETRVSVTVPDTWRKGNNQKPDDALTLLAPGESDFSSCRVRVRQDRRFTIYPHMYAGEIQRLNYSRQFWEDYLSEYDGAMLQSVTDNGGLGRGNASYARASYTTSAGPKVEKEAILYVSLYNDRAYILECSAARSAFSYWEGFFASVIKSVDFRKIIHEFPSGHYRNFLRDKTLRINGARPEDAAYY
jgi:hypothetical protein